MFSPAGITANYTVSMTCLMEQFTIFISSHMH